MLRPPLNSVTQSGISGYCLCMGCNDGLCLLAECDTRRAGDSTCVCLCAHGLSPSHASIMLLLQFLALFPIFFFSLSPSCPSENHIFSPFNLPPSSPPPPPSEWKMHEASYNCTVHFHCIHIYAQLRGPRGIIIIHSHSFASLPPRVTHTASLTFRNTDAKHTPVEVCVFAQIPRSKTCTRQHKKTTHIKNPCPGAGFPHSLFCFQTSACVRVCACVCVCVWP